MHAHNRTLLLSHHVLVEDLLFDLELRHSHLLVTLQPVGELFAFTLHVFGGLKGLLGA